MSLTIGLIGYGHFGAFLHLLAQRFLPEASFKVYARRQQPDGTLFFPLEEVAAADLLVLSVPISAYEATLAQVRPLLGPKTVLVDVATVKVHTGRLLRAAAGDSHGFIATHPMFGPESYGKRGGDVSGLRVVVTDHNLPPESYRALLARLQAAGFKVLEKDAESHDKDLAETLFLTHYIGQVVARGGFERTDIDTVSFGYLMDAVDSVRQDGALFAEVCRFNPYCRQVIERFDASDHALREELLGLLGSKGAGGF
jgi:prephenate dehydrogenase